MAGDPLVFDIETGAAPGDELTEIVARQMADWEPPKNVKDPEKIEAKKQAAIDKIVEKAALDPITGRILAIGYLNPMKQSCLVSHVSEGAHEPCKEVTESDLLKIFWERFTSGRTMVGWNIFRFDLPFIHRRSAILGIDIPPAFRVGSYGKWSGLFHDVMEVWSYGLPSQDKYAALDDVCKACGITGKMDGVDGSMFERMFLHGDASSRRQALEYCKMDMVACWGVAERLGWTPDAGT